MKAGQYVQQGDLIVEKVTKFPVKSSLKALSPVNGKIILAQGSANGNAHVVNAANAKAWVDSDAKIWLELKAGAGLLHEEHKRIMLPAGKYMVEPVVELDPFADEVRAVQD